MSSSTALSTGVQELNLRYLLLSRVKSRPAATHPTLDICCTSWPQAASASAAIMRRNRTREREQSLPPFSPCHTDNNAPGWRSGKQFQPCWNTPRFLPKPQTACSPQGDGRCHAWYAGVKIATNTLHHRHGWQKRQSVQGSPWNGERECKQQQ